MWVVLAELYEYGARMTPHISYSTRSGRFGLPFQVEHSRGKNLQQHKHTK